MSSSYDLLVETAQPCGYTSECVAYNPYQTVFEPDPPLNEYEIGVQLQSPEMLTQGIAMLTYGSDLNLSIKGMAVEQMIDPGQKLTARISYRSASMRRFMPVSYGRDYRREPLSEPGPGRRHWCLWPSRSS